MVIPVLDLEVAHQGTGRVKISINDTNYRMKSLSPTQREKERKWKRKKKDEKGPAGDAHTKFECWHDDRRE